MKIAKIEDLHADAGWRTFSYLKVTTDDGLVGWAEFNDAGWNPGLTAVIRGLSAHAIGQDPREVKDGELLVPTRPGWGCEVNEEAVRAHPPKQAR